jgi:hypothetical protein
VLNAIINLFSSASTAVYNAALEVNGWVWPFWLAASPLFTLSTILANIAWAFVDLGNWLAWVGDRLANLIDWSAINAWFSSWATLINNAWNWVAAAWTNVTSIITSWWSATSYTVQGWIATATQGFANLVAAWDNFRTTVLPTLVSFSWLTTWWTSQLPGIDALINSTLRTWLPFYDDLARLWSGIAEFFADPLQWLYNQMDRFFERFW